MKFPVRIVIKWPGERQGVTFGLFCFALILVTMAYNKPALWEDELFGMILQAVVITGLLNLVAAFHFASNKGSETNRENTGKAFDAITAAATGQLPANTDGAALGAQKTANAAQDQADDIRNEK